MKKYRLTKITVKTRETLALSKDSADHIHESLCPLCRTPLSATLPSPESPAGLLTVARQPAGLPPIKKMGERE